MDSGANGFTKVDASITGTVATLNRLHYKFFAEGNNANYCCRLHKESRCVERISNQPPQTEHILAYWDHCIRGSAFR